MTVTAKFGSLQMSGILIKQYDMCINWYHATFDATDKTLHKLLSFKLDCTLRSLNLTNL